MKNTQNLTSIPDLSQSESDNIQAAISSLRGTLVAWNYSYIDTPLLEPADIFLRKSGEAFTWETYNLIDSHGDRFVLRPEFTSSVARHILGARHGTIFPIRKCYSGQVFRNDTSNEEPRQFSQVGAELVGIGTVDGDAEVVALAIASLQQLGYTNLQVNIGNVGIASSLLQQFGLSDRTIALLLSRLDWLTDIEKSAEEIQQQIGRSQSLPTSGVASNDERLEADGAILLSLLSDADNPVIGSRTLEEIVERYMARIGAYPDIDRTQSALQFLSEFTAIQGPLDECLNLAAQLVERWQLAPNDLNWIAKFRLRLAEYGVSDVIINGDFSLTHDVRYYTGMVFEILSSSSNSTSWRSVTNGGRYDNLYCSLGSLEDIPALGFAHSIEALTDSNSGSDTDPRPDLFTEAGLLIIPRNEQAVRLALERATRQRLTGVRVGILFDHEEPFDLIGYAKDNNIQRILWIDQDGIEKDQDIDE
jgi:ATP phosphoribosyltransferase regulatory subunit